MNAMCALSIPLYMSSLLLYSLTVMWYALESLSMWRTGLRKDLTRIIISNPIQLLLSSSGEGSQMAKHSDAYLRWTHFVYCVVY